MGIKDTQRAGVRAKVFAALAGALIACACQATLGSTASAAALSSSQCRQFPLPERVGDLRAFSDPDLRGTAEACASAAITAGERAPAAWLNAGRAKRIRGERFGAQSDLEGAVPYLQNAINIGEALGARQLPVVDEARIELSRVYRLLAKAAPESQRKLQLYNEAVAALARVSVDTEAVRYERALIEQERDPQAGKTAALEQLRWFARSDDSFGRYADLALVRRARSEFVAIAVELGRQALDAPVTVTSRESSTRENARRALIYFDQAALAAQMANWRVEGVDVPEQILTAQGKASLDAAGLATVNEFEGVDCAGNAGADAALLKSAETAFERAIARYGAEGRAPTPDAYWGRGCAIRAQIQRLEGAGASGASVELGRAIDSLRSGASGAVRNQLGLARAQLAAELWTDARASYQNALTAIGRLAVADTDARRRLAETQARARVELALTFLQNRNFESAELDAANVNAAKSSLAEAVRENAANLQAQLMLGRIALHQNDLGAARDHLAAALRDGPQQTEASYYSSVLETRLRQAGASAGNRTWAVNHATRALEGDRTNDDYRTQACVARIVFGATQDQDANTNYCRADERQRATDLLFEGMFFLRQAYFSAEGRRQDLWANARRTFERGLSRLGSANSTLALSGRPYELRGLLDYGRITALYCLGGLAEGEAPVNAGEWFDYYRAHGLERCRP